MLVSVVLVIIVLAGCGSGGRSSGADGDAQPGTATGASGATTTTTVDPYAIPSVIDAAYIERVLDALESVRVQVRNHVVATRQFDPSDDSRLRAIYGPDFYAFARQRFSDIAIVGDPEMKPVIGPTRSVVTKVQSASASCIWAETTNDDTANQVRPTPPLHATSILRQREHDRALNPTPWVWMVETTPANLVASSQC